MKNFLLLFIMVLMLFASCKKKDAMGYQYTHHISKGGATPKPDDYVYYHVHVRNSEKEVFSTRQQGQEAREAFPDIKKLNGKVPAPLAALSLMSVGDSLTIMQPIDTLKNKPQEFINDKFIIYDIVLTAIKSKAEYDADAETERKKMDGVREKVMAVKAELAKDTIAFKSRNASVTAATAQMAKDYAAGKLNDKIKTTPSGLKYIIVEEGTGAQAAAKDYVFVNYHGVLTDGKKFDGSFSRGDGEPFMFPLGQRQVIPAWDEGIALFKEGTKAYLFCPSKLGYGAQGGGAEIPPNADLVFYVELLKSVKTGL